MSDASNMTRDELYQEVLRLRAILASPPAVAAGGVTEEMLKSALAASASQYEVACNLQVSSPESYAECFGEATPPELAMRAALTAALAVGIREGWQPIETAPKDGTPILLGIPQSRTIFSRIAGAWRGRWRLTWTDEPIHVDPTHWQPLPTPPSRGEGE